MKLFSILDVQTPVITPKMITLLNKKIQINSQTNPEGVVERAIVNVCEEMQIGEEKF